jgi:hypothetical protein
MLEKRYDRTDIQMCGNCKGIGKVETEFRVLITCPVCEGACLVNVRKETTVTITPKILVRS